MPVDPKIIVALDSPTRDIAMGLVDQLDPALCRLKVASTLFTHYGPEFVRELISKGFQVFLDLKFYDIPHQVAGACRSAAELGVWMLNVHASGGRAMMEAAVAALAEYPTEQRPLLIAVTVLTSMGQNDLNETGSSEPLDDQVIRLAKLAKYSGMDGVVCSAQDLETMRPVLGEIVYVTPGIRLPEDDRGDQQRVMGPREAMDAGSRYLVVGRPITESSHPRTVLETMTALLA